MNKYNLFMERLWLVVAILSFAYATYMIGKYSFDQYGIYLLMPLVAASLFYMRYSVRKRMDKKDK